MLFPCFHKKALFWASVQPEIVAGTGIGLVKVLFTKPKVMKQMMSFLASRAVAVLVMISVVAQQAMAQDNNPAVQVNKEKVGNWFQQNWMWVAGAVLLIILIAAFSGGRSKSKTTTVVKDPYGNTKRVTTTEVES